MKWKMPRHAEIFQTKQPIKKWIWCLIRTKRLSPHDCVSKKIGEDPLHSSLTNNNNNNNKTKNKPLCNRKDTTIGDKVRKVGCKVIIYDSTGSLWSMRIKCFSYKNWAKCIQGVAHEGKKTQRFYCINYVNIPENHKK